jgi:NAD(P)-dependent dehydrogenase (short-subunit alcohol dehydrogenase family)
MTKLAGKIALITGGGGGIGRATALAFVAEGAQVVVSDIDAAAADAVAGEINAAGGEALAIAADVSRSDQVAAMIAQIVTRFGRLDIAFNNAAIDIEHEPLDRCSEEMFDDLMRVNVKGVFLCMKYEIQQMLKQGAGAIVNTSSIGGLSGAPRQPIYGATKHAIIGLTKAAALEYGRKGIRVNAVCPGVIRTQMMERALARDPRRKAHVDRIHPIGRVGEAAEIARAVVFLSSEDAAFVLGHALAVDGGYTAT